MTLKFLGAFALLLLAACDQDASTNPAFGNFNDAEAAAKSVSGDATTGLEACWDVCYDDDGDSGTPMACAMVYGKDVDTDGYAGAPVSDTNIFSEGSSGATYICSFTWPSGYVEIDDAGDIADDCDDTATGAAINPMATEMCDTVDNDCDGTVDDGVTRTWYPDVDNDGFGDDSVVGAMSCVTSMEGFVENSTDCNDAQILAYTGATEVCDGVDNDCATGIDEVYYSDSASYDAATALGAVATYTDFDDDGSPGTWYGFMCASQMVEDVEFDYSNDCDDSETGVYTFPGSATLDSTTACMTDFDGDGFGDESVGEGITAGNDCNDSVTGAAINPDAMEICDAMDVDEDCNDLADDADSSATGQSTWYLDADHDNYTGATTQAACDQPVWSELSNELDCNDTVETGVTVYPGAIETCNGIDDDCDMSTDEGVLTTYYVDVDNDNYGLTASTTTACSEPSGYAAVGADCNDGAASVNPGATESCNSVDDDCDGVSDDGLATSVSYHDSDGDGYGDLAHPSSAYCAVPSGYAGNSTDCNDGDFYVNPGVADTANNGLDDNCDNTAVDYICEWDTFTSSSVYKQLWLDSQDTSADDGDWNYPGLARGAVSSTTATCASRTIVGGEDWKIQGQFSTSATSGTFYAANWTFSAYMNASTDFATVTVMEEAVTVTKTSWGGGADGYFTVAATLPN